MAVPRVALYSHRHDHLSDRKRHRYR
jgi:hypothetical protein